MKNISSIIKFLKEDTWQSWLVSLVLIIIFIKFIFFPSVSLITSSPLPLVVVESCSMYHQTDFEEWWDRNSEPYKNLGITKSEFENFPNKNGLNKGDIILVWGRSGYKEGDIIIFNTDPKFNLPYPIIHRLVDSSPFSTRGDNNSNQAEFERDIKEQAIQGKSLLKIP